jgi:hypothetical protein
MAIGAEMDRGQEWPDRRLGNASVKDLAAVAFEEEAD